MDSEIEALPVESSPTLLCVGVIRRYKAYHDVIAALPKVSETVPEARLVIAGRRSDNEYASELLAQAREIGVASRVQLLFDVTDKEKTALLGEARVVVVPSKLEGYGIISIEANAAGRPIIASSGVPEAAVEHGANGLRYQYGNIEELENAIVSILRDDELYEELARGSRTWARARTVDATGSEFRAMLAVAIEGGRSRPSWLRLRSGDKVTRRRRNCG